jgi:hypothetical protein
MNIIIHLIIALSLFGGAKHKAVLNWVASPSQGVVYRVYRGPHLGPYVRVAAGIIKTTYTDSGNKGQIFCYVVSAYDQKKQEESKYSNEACGTIQ